MARAITNAAEEDAFTRWRRYLHWSPGERKDIKRKANRRERRQTREKLKSYDETQEDVW